MREKSQPLFLDTRGDNLFKLERSLLKDQATELLRDCIISGQIPPDTKLVEREVAELLGTSRAPARDALIELEKEGLIVTKSNGRHVIELSERDIRELYQVRLALEKLAVELAIQNASPENRTALLTKLQEMKEAVARNDYSAFTMNDVEMHRLIWVQANNRHLLKALNSMVGPIFMFVARHAKCCDWNETLELHEDLVTCVNSGDVRMVLKSIERHLDNALHRSLRVFRVS